MNTRRPGSIWSCRFFHCARLRATSGRSRSLATTLFFETELLRVDEIPHRAIVDLEPALGEFRHQPAQREGPLPNALGQKGRVPVADRLRLVSAHLARRHAARLVKPPHPVDDRADPNAELSRRSMPRNSALQNRGDSPLTKIVRIRPSHPCWPPSSQHPESENPRFANPPCDSIQIHLALAGGVVAGLVGLGTGYLTLRLRGIFFAIATLALAVVLQTLITRWDFVGGSAGVYAIRPKHIPVFGSYIEYMTFLMLALAVIVVAVSRAIEISGLGLGFVAIRDDEVAAEATGVPTLRLKLIATTLSGAFMGMAGAPLPYYVTFLEPSSAFNLSYAVNSIAMPLIGGTIAWFGPVLGALLLGIAQQVLTVTISSEVNLLVVGLLLIGFVVLAPQGLIGLLGLTGRRRAV
jgi:branched-chain amino acid transport system permease protein